ncbi:MAG: DUF5717 family protein [Lachnospiraceae bacterium]|nr:DUF5717 family protein [Lachnospiraceae bacterium]
MENHIADILNGRFEYDVGTLTFPEKRIEREAEEGQKISGKFRILSSVQRRCNGTLYTSEPRLELDRASFSASEVEVHYTFDTTGLEEGDIIKGEIDVVSDAGEYHLPFVFNIQKHFALSSQGKIKNLFHFTNLARADFDEAVKIFYSPEFNTVFRGADEQYKNFYRAFSTLPGSRENLEEFLVSVRKKAPVMYTVDRTEVEEEIGDEDECISLILKKSGWGDVSLRVSSDADFAVVGKTFITEENFDGDVCYLKILLIEGAMHGGTNVGTVTISGNHYYEKIRIVCHVQGERPDRILARQKLEVSLMNEFLKFRMHEIRLDAWCRSSMILIEKINSVYPHDLASRLYMVHVLILQSRMQEAESVLGHIKSEFDIEKRKPEYRAYLLYLESMLKRDEFLVKENAEKIKEFYKSKDNSARLLWLLMYMDEEMENDPQRKMAMMRKIYEAGRRTPLLYSEAMLLISADPSLMKGMTEFEVNALWWAAKHGIFNEKLMTRIAFNGSRLRRYVRTYVRLAGAYYGKYRSEEILSAICTHLIQNHAASPIHFKWFRIAVERQLKITRLYEYYMYSFPTDSRALIDRSVLMYFKMGTDIPDDLTAQLYLNLIQHRNTAGEYLMTYNPQIAEFALRKAIAGKMSEELACIYEYAVSIRGFDRHVELMNALSMLCFTHHITTENKSIVSVSVIEFGFKKERRRMMIGGEAYIDIYSNNYELFFEDSYGNRTADRTGIVDRKMLQPIMFERFIRANQTANVGFAFYICGTGRRFLSVNEENKDAVKALTQSDEILDSERNEMRRNLISFYYENDRFDELDEALLSVEPGKLNEVMRAEYVNYLVIRGMQQRAYDILKKYGASRLDSKVIVRLASRIIRDDQYTSDKFLMDICISAFRHGKYDEVILEFLEENYNGSIRHLRDIWKAAQNFNISAVHIERRMISQMLFAHSFVGEADDVFVLYAKPDNSDDLVKAWLTYAAYDYFVKNRITKEYIFERIYSHLEHGEKFIDVVSLAMLRYFSEKKEVNPVFRSGIARAVRHYLQRGIVFEFFRRFRSFVPEMMLYDDRTFIEYRTNPDKTAVIHYMITKENGNEGGFYTEAMKNIVGGVYVKNFTLFYGEQLQYYITEEDGSNSTLTTSRTLDSDDERIRNSDTRFDILNSILVSRTMGDSRSMDDLLKLYILKSRAVDQKFELI